MVRKLGIHSPWSAPIDDGMDALGRAPSLFFHYHTPSHAALTQVQCASCDFVPEGWPPLWTPPPGGGAPPPPPPPPPPPRPKRAAATPPPSAGPPLPRAP